jgi:hypothetical protein
MSKDFVVDPWHFKINGLSCDVLRGATGTNGGIQGRGPVAARRCDWDPVIVPNRLKNVLAECPKVLDFFFTGFVRNSLALCRLGLCEFPEGEVFG